MGNLERRKGRKQSVALENLRLSEEKASAGMEETGQKPGQWVKTLSRQTIYRRPGRFYDIKSENHFWHGVHVPRRRRILRRQAM
ncbi:MAG: hypothetical protein ACAI35_09595 [Candidatus Methylacidiphilales bacterium]|nr:hypothetical protein [Candidatus Methylacidiphilales bacterium]